MSSISITIGVPYSTSENTLLHGYINTTTPLPNSIQTEPICKSNNIKVIIDKTTENIFKDKFNSAPVQKSNIKVYDQSGFIIGDYLESRVNNKSGTVNSTTDTKVLLSDIIIQPNNDGEVFLVISLYSGLSNSFLEETKQILIEKDFKLLESKYDLSKITLFIVNNIYDEIMEYYDISKVFKDIKYYSYSKLIPSLVEYISGSIISGSKPEFQDFISFGKDIEVVNSYFNDNENHLNYENRRNGRIHISSSYTTTKTYFIILLSHKNKDDINIKTTMGTKISIDEFVFDNITELMLSTSMNSILFMNQLIQSQKDKNLKEYILANPEKVITYIYNSPIINIFKDTEYKYMIKVFNNYILQNVYLKINTILTQHQNYVVPPPPPLFNRYYDSTYSPGIETQKLERNITQG